MRPAKAARKPRRWHEGCSRTLRSGRAPSSKSPWTAAARQLQGRCSDASQAGDLPMRIHTRSLGEVDATPESFLTLPDGLVGYEGQREFALVSPAHYAPFQWL